MTLPPFHNEPVLELRRSSVREQLPAALRAHDDQLPLRAPVWIADSQVKRDDFLSTDPGDPDRVVGVATAATEAEVDAAISAAQAGFREWSHTPVLERAQILIKAADILRRDRLRLAALILRETAKPWPEADADVCEAIDFLEYYAREAVRISQRIDLLQVPGERNYMQYQPRGVVVVISPWNFPLAIPCGMVSAGLATGNAVILKPAEQSPACAFALVGALRKAGVPPRALALLPGEGPVGAQLVKDPRVHTIAFTGSVPVGLEIIKSAADTPPEQKHLKRVIAEMGGKNCVLVDSDADLDDAVPAIVRSAYNYAGQKCSAAARIMVHEAIVDSFIERLSGAVAVLEVGPADALDTEVPAVIEAEAQQRVNRYRELAQREGRIASEVTRIPANGWYARPLVVTDLPPDSKVLSEEIFGPILAVESVKSMEEACDRVDSLRYALTGGLFARNPRTIEYVIGRTPVGNLYVNRAVTGAMVARQPFGGNRLSGTGTKAGGPDYLAHFVEPRVVAENTVRHGLVV